MNTNIEVLRELDELVEAARLLGVTQAKKGFGCYTHEDSRFERAMYESIDKHRAALLDWEAKQPAPQQPAASSGAAAGAEPAVWVAADTLNSPHPACISSLAYMSQLDRERGREYVPLYTAPQQPAGRVHDLAARLVDELDGLVEESDGVSGLHLNGDVATWDELLPGGRFERLSSLDELRAALAAQQQGGAE